MLKKVRPLRGCHGPHCATNVNEGESSSDLCTAGPGLLTYVNEETVTDQASEASEATCTYNFPFLY